MNRQTVILIAFVACLISFTMLAGCYMMNVIPLKDHCAQWNQSPAAIGGSYTLVPCK